MGRFPTLSETFVVSQIEGLVARGHAVSILADGPSDEGQAAGLAARVAGVAGIAYVTPRRGLLARGFEGLPYRARRRLAAIAERRFCRENDVVVCNFGWTGAQVAQSVAGRSRRARLVTIFHGDDMSRSLKHAPPHPYAHLFQDADILASISEFWRARLLEMGAPASKVLVHHMGVDLDRLRFKPVRLRHGEAFQLVSVGRLVEKKGTEFALRALAQLRQHAPDLRFRLRILGDGPLRAQLEALRDDLELGPCVEFLGAQPHAAVTEALASADGFVLPSVVASDGDMEGIPVALMEAMAVGSPVVSTRHSGIPELIEHEVSGLLAAERDVGDLARQLERLMRDVEGRATRARAARRTVEADFDQRRLDDDLERLLHRVAHGTPEIATAPAAASRTMREPLVSVVVPTFNRARTLRTAVESILAQSYANLEVLIVDDGSTDATPQIVAALNDPRVRYIRQPNGGAASARNRGMREAKGELIGFLDSDDEWLPEKLERQVALIRRSPENVGLFYTGALTCRSKGPEFIEAPVHRGYVFREMLLRNAIHSACGVVIRREVIETVGYFDETLPAIEDFDYWTRIARFYAFDYIRDPLVVYNDQSDDPIERRSRNFHANMAARATYGDRYAHEAARAGVRHLFLLESARRHLQSPLGDRRAASRLLLKAIRLRPAAPRLYVWLVFSVLPGARASRLLPRLRALRTRLIPRQLWFGTANT